MGAVIAITAAIVVTMDGIARTSCAAIMAGAGRITISAATGAKNSSELETAARKCARCR